MTSTADPLDSIRYIPLLYNNSDSHASALRIVLALRPEWKQSQETVAFVRFTDGITNTLLKAVNKLPGLSETDIDKQAILLRAYGRGTDVLIDREREMRCHSLLAQHQLAPQLLARFDNGLLYEFIEGMPCSPADLRRPEVWRGVAKRLGEWHAVIPIEGILSKPNTAANDMILNYGSGPQHLRKPSLDSTSDMTPGKPIPNVWTVMHKWIAVLPESTEAQKTRKESLYNELRWVIKKLANTSGIGGKALVFSHCDLLSGNVIVLPKNEAKAGEASQANGSTKDSTTYAVSFIDYEYATPAPAVFDIVNHFAEWGGFDCDFNVLPTRSQRRGFLKEYLSSYSTHMNQDFSAADLDALFNEVDAFRGIPGFYWGIWALIQAQISQIDFDYASYAEVRLGEYWAWKAELDGSRAASGAQEMPLRERRWAQEN